MDGIKNNFQKLNTAYNLNKKILSEIKNRKFYDLERWILQQSRQHHKDNFEQFKQNYKTFSRGALVYVDFGCNLETEFSGMHFAIVINKKDNQRKSKLTVVPITSKNRTGSIPIKTAIFDSIIKVLAEKLTISNEIDLLILKIKHCLKNNEICKELEENLFLKIKELDYQFKNIESDFTLSLCDELSIELNEYIEKLLKDCNLLKKYNKDSFVLVSDITTISKCRIIKKTKIDELQNKFLIEDSILDLIDNEILKKFIK